MKLVGNTLKVVFEQGVKKAGAQGFKREIKNIIGDVAGQVKKDIKECNANGCFPAGMKVLMADGSNRPIEHIAEGDLILADNPEDAAPPQPRRVTGVLRNHTDYLTLVRVASKTRNSGENEVLRSTNMHPYWVMERGWVPARELAAGDHLLGSHGQPITVLSVQEQRHTCDTWNLSVEGMHSFFVENDGEAVLVHNTLDGDRTYIVYTFTWTEDGVKKAYTGQHGSLSEVELSPRRCFNDRYPGDYVEVRKKDPANPKKTITEKIPKSRLDEVRFNEHLHIKGNNKIQTSGGKWKRPGELWAAGYEQLHWELANQEFGEANVLNRKQPCANKHGEVDEAWKVMRKRPGGQCPRRNF